MPKLKSLGTLIVFLGTFASISPAQAATFNLFATHNTDSSQNFAILYNDLDNNTLLSASELITFTGSIDTGTIIFTFLKQVPELLGFSEYSIVSPACTNFISSSIAAWGFENCTDQAFYSKSTSGWTYQRVEVETPSSVPLPAALPLLASGLGALGVFGWRKRRKEAAVTA